MTLDSVVRLLGIVMEEAPAIGDLLTKAFSDEADKGDSLSQIVLDMLKEHSRSRQVVEDLDPP